MIREDNLLIEEVQKAITPWLNCKLIVSFSGGKDSSVLLSIMRQLRDKGVVADLSALHIHHGLHRDASAWASHCEMVCSHWDIPVRILYADVQKSEGHGLEAAARNARYRIFSEHLDPGVCLLQAHHAHDMIETILYRLCRGTGISGLRGIPKQRVLGNGLLLRPMLSCTRDRVNCYAKKKALKYVQDFSNYDRKYDRNYLRHEVIPLLENRWPKSVEHFSILSEDIVEINREIEFQVEKVLGETTVFLEYWGLKNIQLLDIQRLNSLSSFMARNVVRLWLLLRGALVPDRKTLECIFSELIPARADAAAVIKLDNFEIRRFKGNLIVLPMLICIRFPKYLSWDWQRNICLELPDGRKLCINSKPPKISSDREEKGMVRFALPNGVLMVRFRDGISSGQKFSIAGRAGRKTLKRWLQEYNVPPWERAHVPILFFGEEMIGVPDLWCCSNFYSKQGLRITGANPSPG